QGGGRGDPQLLGPALTAGAAASGDGHGDRQRRPQPHAPLSIKTDVALTAAVAGAPTTSWSSSTASRVTAAVSRNGPALSPTSAITPSTSMDLTTPGKRLRADSEWPV